MCMLSWGWEWILTNLDTGAIFFNLRWATRVSLPPPYRRPAYSLYQCGCEAYFTLRSRRLPLSADVMGWGLYHIKRRQPSLAGRVQGGHMEQGTVFTRKGTDSPELQNACQSKCKSGALHSEVSDLSGRKARIPLECDDFLRVVDNRTAVLRHFLLKPKCPFASLSLSLSQPLLCSVGFPL